MNLGQGSRERMKAAYDGLRLTSPAARALTSHHHWLYGSAHSDAVIVTAFIQA
jgi:hypothetical protein